MGHSLNIIFCYACFLGLCSYMPQTSSARFHTPNTLLKYNVPEIILDILNALSDSLHFMADNSRDLNLDGLIGTRIASDQMDVFLRKALHYQSLLNPAQQLLLEIIRDLQEGAEMITDTGIPFVNRSDPIYYKKIGSVLRKSQWALSYPSRLIDEDFCGISYTGGLNPLFPQREMEEDDSDDCISELLGTSNTSDSACSISESCWHMMTSPVYSEYLLTHQIFYLEIGEMSGCFYNMMFHAIIHDQRSIDYLQDLFCSNIFCEAEFISKKGYPESHRDLFMEQIALCGLLGYKEFCQPEWIRQILQWQHQNGCYGKDSSIFHQDHKKYLDSIGGIVLGNLMQKKTKRREKWMGDGCLAHRTTVAIGALTICMNIFTEQWIHSQM